MAVKSIWPRSHFPQNSPLLNKTIWKKWATKSNLWQPRQTLNTSLGFGLTSSKLVVTIFTGPKIAPLPIWNTFSTIKVDPDHGSEPRVPLLGKSVINLSKYPLSDIEQSVLDKGLNFIPTPKNVTKIPIMEAASNFGRRLKIAYHFRKSKFNHQPEKFIDKSQ